MIFMKDYDKLLKELGQEYFVSDVQYVENLRDWSEQKNIDLSEPSQPLKLITDENNGLIMTVQSELDEEMLNNTINALEVRSSLKDTVTNYAKTLNSIKKRLAYCFLKEYARTLKDVGGDELHEDEWSLKEMEKLGFFKE